MGMETRICINPQCRKTWEAEDDEPFQTCPGCRRPYTPPLKPQNRPSTMEGDRDRRGRTICEDDDLGFHDAVRLYDEDY